MRWLLALAAVSACVGTCDEPSSTVDAAPSVVVTDASPDVAREAAATGPTEAERQAYAAALVEGRKATLAKSYKAAVDAFTRALAAIPRDGRALSERGYAHFLDKDYGHAETDFEFALASIATTDKKLLAQVEYNLGLVAEAQEHPGVAAGYFHRSYELNPTDAAKKRMGACPVTQSVPAVNVFASRAAAESTGGAPLEALDGVAGAFTQPTGNGTANVLVPIDGGALARVEVGIFGVWRCGYLAEITAERSSDTWKIVYQAYRGMTTMVCWCDGVMCDNTGSDPSAGPPCKCDPYCPLICAAGADEPKGQHIEVYLDAKTGAGLAKFDVDHEYLAQVTLHADVAKRTFSVSGCP